MITPADVDDRKPLEYKYFVEFVYGKLVGDKGYFLSFYSKISKYKYYSLSYGIYIIWYCNRNSIYFNIYSIFT